MVNFKLKKEKLLNGFVRFKVVDLINKEIVYFKNKEEARDYILCVKECNNMIQTTLI